VGNSVAVLLQISSRCQYLRVQNANTTIMNKLYIDKTFLFETPNKLAPS